MKTFLLPLCPPALVLLMTPALHAALNPSIVPADAQWVVHADFTALRDTALGQRLMEQLPPLELGKSPDDPVRPNFRKILDTAGTATAFGSDLSGKPEAIDGALVLQGTAELRKIAEGFVAQMSLSKPDDAVEIKGLPFEAHLIAREIYVGFPTEPVVLVSKSRDQLIKAYDVLRGQAPSLAKSPSQLTQLLPKGGTYYLLGASNVPSAHPLVTSDGPQARILQMAQAGSFAIGEEADQAVARVLLVASSADVAQKLVKIVEGITAMVSLAETNDERLAEFVNSLKVSRNDRSVDLRFAYPTERILQMVDELKRAEETSHEDEPAHLEIEGEVVAQWIADQDLGGVAPAPHNFAVRTIDSLTLAPGSTVVLTGQRDDGEHARWDYVELTPVDGSATPQRFEAEYMRLDGYGIEKFADASGGEMLKAERGGTARFRFTGPAGTYRMTIRYVDETDGKAPFAVSILPPEPSTS